MHAYNIVRAVRQREGASGIPLPLPVREKELLPREEIQFLWILVIDPVASLCRSARKSVSCALQEEPRDHYVLCRCFKTVHKGEMHSTSKTE